MDSEETSDSKSPMTAKDDNVSKKNEEAQSITVPDSTASMVGDLFDAGLVKPTEQFKSYSQIGKKSKKMTEEDKSKIFEMVKGLAKYNDYEEDPSDDDLNAVPKQKKGKSPHKSHLHQEPSSLYKLIDSELAILHPSDDSKSLGGDTSYPIGKKADPKSQKSGVHIASVSEEKQLEFESLLKEDLVSATLGIEELQISAGARPKVNVSVETEHAGRHQQKENVETVKESSKKKGENKKKSPKRKGGQGASQEENQELGSYSQLLISMGKRSPQRRIELLEDAKEKGQKKEQKLSKVKDQKVEDFQEKPQVEGQGKKKRNKKQKGMQQVELLQAEVLEDQRVDRPQSANKGKKKGKGSPNVVQEKNLQTNRPQSAQSDRSPNAPGSNKQKKKDKRGSLEPVEQIKTPGERPTFASKQKSSQQVHMRPGLQDQRLQCLTNMVDESYTELLVFVPKREHMYIIGPQGRHIQEIMMVTGVTVSVPPLNSSSEEIVLRGDKMQLGPAVALMFSKSQMEASAMMGGAMSPLVQGQGQSLNINTAGQGCGLQMPKKGPGSKNREHDFNDENLTINVNLNQTGKGQKRQHERYVTTTPANQGNHEHLASTSVHYGHHEHLNLAPVHPGHHEHHVISTPVHHGQRQVKGQHLYQHGQHLHQQGHGKYPQGQGLVYQQYQGQDPGSATKSQGRRQRKKRTVYAEYMPMEEVSQGLKRGILVEGPIRINPKNFEEGYVPHPDGKSDILICGTKGRNRALNGDVVAVELMDEGDWKLNRQELEDLEKSMTGDREDGQGSSQDSDPEVVIESEEIVEISTAKGDNLMEQSQNQKKGDNKSPMKKFTSLSDMMTGQSPAKQKLLTEEGRGKIKKMLQRTGKVVAVVEWKHSRACTGFIKPMQDKSKDNALFSPVDHRIPRIIVPMDNCPKDFLERPDDFAKTLYVCRITDWKIDSFYAEGCLAKSLGEAGEIEPETVGMLIENGVDFDEFPQEALDCLPKLSPWKIPEEEFSYRRDYRSSCVFTIDPATARDLDDAVSCEDLGDGKFKVGVHIADVSFFLKENSVLDRVAALRSTSVYLVHKVIPMLPRLLCEELCSLNPDVDRLTFSVEWVISEEGEIEEEWFGRSVIRSCAKLAYDHAQGFIEEPDRNWTQEELPAISENFAIEDIKTRVLNLQKIAVNLRKARMDGGALRLDQVKLQYSLDDKTGLPNGYWVYQQRDSNRLIEEFMLLANMAVAHKINSEFPDKALLRRHPPPQEKMVENLRDQCSALGIHIDISSAGTIQRSLRSYTGNDDDSMARMQVLVALCAKPMQNAKYFCTGCIEDESMYNHYALNVPLYTHFTSPIRRYPDVMVHRLLGASLGYCEESSKNPGEIQKLADNANDKKTAAKRVGELSSELFFAVFVKAVGPLEEKAMVMGVLDKAFDIFVLKLGVSKRVYCDKLPIKEKIFRRERKVPSLVLVWNGEAGEPDVRQEITIFSVVDCILEQGEQPLQWTAVIKKPTTAPVMTY